MPILQTPPAPPAAVSPRTVVAHRDLQAKIQCTILADGRVADCRVLSETPKGLGAGAAALKLARLFKMKPKAADGRSTAGGTVIIPLRFHEGDAETQTPPTPPAAAPTETSVSPPTPTPPS